MKKHGITMLLFGLASFYFLTTDVILSDKTVILLGQAKVIPVYSLAMLCLAIGFVFFSALHRKLSSPGKLKKMLTTVFLTSSLTLVCFTGARAQLLFLIFAMVHMLSTGVMGGAVHYYAAMALKDRAYSGRVIGCAIGMEALLQIVLLMCTSSLYLRAWILVAVLAIVFYLVIWKTPLATEPQKPQRVTAANTPAKSYLYFTVAIVGVISLMGGFNDGIVTTLQTEQAVNIYSFPRLFYLAGVVTAGFIADMQERKYLPLVMLSVMMSSAVGVMFLGNPLTYIINVCIFFLFAGFAILYFTVTFFDIAPFTNNPMLWAGMGRTVRFVFIAVGDLSANFVFTTVPFNGIIAIYIALSVILLGLFYLTGSLAIKRQSTTFSGYTKEEMIDKARTFALTNRELEVLTQLIDNKQTKEISQCLGIAERTVKFHLTNIFMKTHAKNRVELLIILSKK